MAQFGFQKLPTDEEKTRRVSSVFREVAPYYDLMNDIMSLGLHRWWKTMSIMASHILPGQWVLDLAGGSGDLTKKISKQVGPEGRVYLCDIQWDMLQLGKARLLDASCHNNVYFCQGNAESLPFESNYFHRLTIAFGLRNVSKLHEALSEVYRVLKPGGKIMILEFSHVHESVKSIYDWYSFKVIPWLGEKIAHSEESYRYLVESIRLHPNQRELKTKLEQVGFEDCKYQNLTLGIAAIHTAYKY